ncbi:MAG: prolyl oligopeptidase family serine peptidase [Jiangellaceae bacterium]|nr:prolyl oligopeptidase family serine peptidase [Jiangellaceae bacterium]
MTPDAPPFLLLRGRADQLVPCSQSERLRDLLAAAGASVDFRAYDGADHMWLGAPNAAMEVRWTAPSAS